VRYTYRITGRKTVEPTDVAALKYDGDKKMLTLITCWPLGTSRYRLLIFAEQISPTTETNPVDQNQAPAQNSDAMPKNENTVLENVWNGITGN
jgi:sortase (surface protein transpeptidase)